MADPPYAPTTAVYEPTRLDEDVIGGAKAKGEALKASVLATPALGAAADEIVRVVAPDGKGYGLPRSQLNAAILQGYQIETPEQRAVREYLDENKGLSGDARVALDSFASEATFGVLGAIEDNTGDELERAKREELKKAHGVANILGGIGGFGLSMFYGGESGVGLFSKAAKAGTIVERGILGLGEHVAEKALADKAAGTVIGQALGKLAPIGSEAAVEALGPSFAKKLIASGAGGAVEGMVLAAPRALTEASLGNPAAAAETLMYAGGGGAVLGFLSPTAAKVKEVATGGLGLGGGGGPLKDRVLNYLDEQTLSAVNPIQKFAKRFAEIGKKESAEVIRADGLMPHLGEDAEAFAARVEAAKEATGGKIGEVYTKASQGLDGNISSAEVVARLRAEVQKPLTEGLGSVGNEALASKVDAFIGSLEAKTGEMGGMMSVEEWHKLRQLIDGKINWRDVANADFNGALADIRNVLSDTLYQRVAAVEPKMLTELRALNKQYAVLTTLADTAEHNITRGIANRGHSLTDYLGNIIGGTVGGAIGGGLGSAIGAYVGGAVNNVARRYGPGMIVRGGEALLGIERATKIVAEKMDGIPQAMNSMASNAPLVADEEGVTSAAPKAAIVSFLKVMGLAGGSSVGGDKAAAHQSAADKLAELASDPERMQAKLQELTAPYAKEAPNVSSAFAMKTAQMVTYLAGKMPKNPEPPSPWTKSTWRPSDAEMHDFARIVQIAGDPFVALKHMADKSLSPAEVEALQVIWPETYAKMRERILEYAASGALVKGKAKGLSYGHQVSVSTFLGEGTDPALKQIKAFQAAFAAPEMKGQPHMPGGGGLGGGAMKGPAFGTDVQRITAK